MALHGFLAHREHLRHLAGEITLGDQPHHFLLALGEHGGRVGAAPRVWGRAAVAACGCLDHRGTDVVFAARQRLDRLEPLRAPASPFGASTSTLARGQRRLRCRMVWGPVFMAVGKSVTTTWGCRSPRVRTALRALTNAPSRCSDSCCCSRAHRPSRSMPSVSITSTWVLRRTNTAPSSDRRREVTRVAARGSCARWKYFDRISVATHAWVAKLVDARDLRKLSTRLGNGRREWGQSRWNSSTSGWLQYRAKPWFGSNR